MWEKWLPLIKNSLNKFGETINESVTNIEIDSLINSAKEQLGHNLFEEYLSFLKVMNGFEFDGFTLYGADNAVGGYVDMNNMWAYDEYQKQYMFFGHDSISWYCYSLVNEEFQILDKPSGELMEQFATFNEMLDCFFKSCFQVDLLQD